LKAVREQKQIAYKGKSIKITADFSTKTLKIRRAWGEIFQVLKENNFNPRILCPAKLSFKIDGAIKVFHDRGLGQGGEMTQALYAYMNNKIK
jgi:hypothetical protein